MQQDDTQENTHHDLNNTQGHDAMSQGSKNDDVNTNQSNTHNVEEAPSVSRIADVNGGIEDDDLLEMMATDVKAMHTHTATDLSPPSPYGIREEKC